MLYLSEYTESIEHPETFPAECDQVTDDIRAPVACFSSTDRK